MCKSFQGFVPEELVVADSKDLVAVVVVNCNYIVVVVAAVAGVDSRLNHNILRFHNFVAEHEKRFFHPKKKFG